MIKSCCFLILIILHTNLFASDDVREKINIALSRLPAGTVKGVMIYNPLSQDTIFAMNHKISMIPASNTKLFTTAAALSVMGSDFELATRILTDDKFISGGIIKGNLYIKGYGNSLFTKHDLTNLVYEIRLKGIREVRGNIIGDDTYFDDVYVRDDWIPDEVANVKLPPISALVIDRNRTVVQRKRGRRVRSYSENIKNPPLHAARMLSEELMNAGITVNGNAAAGVAPASTITLAESRIPITEVLNRVNKSSDNFLAECLFKTIGAEASKEQGNSFYSTQAVLTFIRDNAIFYQGSSVVDGSGISRFNQITVGAIVGLLEKMYFDLTNFDVFNNSLSIAGVDGTLKNRMTETCAERNFYGKTGTLNGVSSLAGYLTTSGGEELIVCIFFEFTAGGAKLHRDVQDQIIIALCELM